jgi:hypothetical protein
LTPLGSARLERGILPTHFTEFAAYFAVILTVTSGVRGEPVFAAASAAAGITANRADVTARTLNLMGLPVDPLPRAL